MPPPQVFFNITSPTGGLPFVDRTFALAGNISWMFVPTGRSLVSKSVTVRFGPGGSFVGAAFSGSTLNWSCSGTVSPSTPWGSMVQLTITASVTFRFFRTPFEPDFETLTNTNTFMVRLFPAIAPTINLAPFASPIVAAQMPVSFAFTGSATSPQAPIQLVQYKVEGGQFCNVVKVSTNDWSQFRIVLPLPPTPPDQPHTLTIRATDVFGTVGEISQPVPVQAQPPIVVPPGGKTTFSGAPTTSSITSWTRLEPQSNGADIGASSSARVFDPLWMLTRQWQMGEFQAEDAGTPIQARVRATTGMLTRRYSGELPKSPTGGPVTVAGAAYDPSRTPLEVLVERRSMRAANETDPRMVTFAVEAGLHFLRMLELQTPTLTKYRAAFLTKFALQPLTSVLADDATVRYMQSMVGRAPDGRLLANTLRTTGAAQLVLDAALNILAADRLKVQQTLTSWLSWYDSMYSEPDGTADDAWNPPRLEYALSVGTRLSANATDEITFSASEIDGPIDWSSFDINGQASLGTTADQSFTPIVEATIPAPVNFPGAPAPRFWEMEDARIAYGLVPVGPTDLAHLMMIEYASTYGNDWFVVPLTLPVGSVTRVDSLVVTDTFGVRSLVRPLGDPAIPAPFFSMWQPALKSASAFSAAVRVATNRFFLPPTLGRTMDSAPLEDVLFMRDEMANVAWAIERTIESPIEQPAQRYEAPDAALPAADLTLPDLPRYLLSTEVPPNWIPLLPVQIPNPNPGQQGVPGQVLTRLKRGAILQQADGKPKLQSARGEVLFSLGNLLLFDEEVPREGARVTRQRRLARWTDGSTWLWTSFRNQVGQGEGSSQLQFDQVLEPRGTAAAG
jgi:hypothetical protein